MASSDRKVGIPLEHEAEVLAWLLDMPEVAEAARIALAGREADAAPILVKRINDLLQEDAELGGTTKKSRRTAPSGSAKCVCIIMCGLNGSGKSAVCRMLCEVLGGLWLDYDSFVTNLGVRAYLREGFANELRAMLTKSLASAEHNQGKRLLFVDRPNTLRDERMEILQELQRVQWEQKGGKIIFVQFSHFSDIYGPGADGHIAKRFGETHISLCMQRIEERGAAHPRLRPSLQLRSTLEKIAKAAESLSKEELSQAHGCIVAEMSKPAVDVAFELIEEMSGLKLLDRPGISPTQLRLKLEAAWRAHDTNETELRSRNASQTREDHLNQNWLGRSQDALDEEMAHALQRKRQAQAELACEGTGVPVALYWKVDVPEVSKVLSRGGILPPGITATKEPHTTLLYLGGEGSDAQIAQRAGLSEDAFVNMREALEALEGEEFDVHLTEIVVEENVVSAVVALPPILPCQNKVPHITLGTRPGVPARFTNEILEEVKFGGRTEGINFVKLAKPKALKGRLMLHYSTMATDRCITEGSQQEQHI